MKKDNEILKIWNYINTNHVISVSTTWNNEIWSASLFYVSDHIQNCVWVMTDESTMHGAFMSKNNIISGTISSQESNIQKLKGIQYLGNITLINSGDEYENGLRLYQKKFPIAHVHKKALWKLLFTKIKFTNNTLGFGTKLIWERETINE